MKKLKIEAQKSRDDGMNIFLNNHLLARLTPHIISFEDGNEYGSCDAYINEEEGNIYLLHSIGKVVLLYFFKNYPKSQNDKYRLINIIGIDVMPLVVMEGEMVHGMMGLHSLYVGGHSEYTPGNKIIRIDPIHTPPVEERVKPYVLVPWDKEKIEQTMKEFFPETYEQSLKNLEHIKLF